MKAIIDGKRYDTEAPKTILIGEADYGNANDFNSWSAGLYRTGQGSFFLAGEGGPNTQWAEPTGGGWVSNGSGIIPLTKEDAFKWAQENLDPAKVEEFFADMIEEA